MVFHGLCIIQVKTDVYLQVPLIHIIPLSSITCTPIHYSESLVVFAQQNRPSGLSERRDRKTLINLASIESPSSIRALLLKKPRWKEPEPEPEPNQEGA